MNIQKKLTLIIALTYCSVSFSKVNLYSDENLEITIPKNSICFTEYEGMFKSKETCLKNDIIFGAGARRNDYFNFDRVTGFKKFNTIQWQEKDLTTGETQKCTAYTDQIISGDNISMVFSKGCKLKVTKKGKEIHMLTNQIPANE